MSNVSDFNDLWRREGPEMALKELDPANAAEAVTVSDGEDGAESTEPSRAEGSSTKRRKKPIIVIRNELNHVTDEALGALEASCHLGVFVRGRMLVLVAHDGADHRKWLRRPRGAPVIVPIELPRMLGLMDDAAAWVRETRDGALNVARPPEWVGKQVLGRLEWPFPYLEAVIEAPTLRPDGSVISEAGWDQATGLLYLPTPGVTWIVVPPEPTQSDVQDAIEVLSDPVRDFRFVADSDRSAFVAAVLSLSVRHLIDGPVPGFAIRAPTPGSGKTLLADVIGIAATGRVPAAMSMTHQSEEFRKRVMAIAMDGSPMVLLENLSGSLGSDVLAGALTATEWKDRLLGKTQMVSAPLAAVWLMTGNNLGFKRTLGRRVIPIDLDTELETPEDRTDFTYEDLRSHVRQQRPKLVAAGLTLLRAFHLAGRPTHGSSRMGSFEAWDDLIRSSVVWAGLADPAGTDGARGRGRIRAQADDDLEGLAALLETLKRLYPNSEPFSTAKVIQHASGDTELSAVLDRVAAHPKTGRATTSSLGGTFRESKDRPISGLVLRRLKRSWFVQQIGGAPCT